MVVNFLTAQEFDIGLADIDAASETVLAAGQIVVAHYEAMADALHGNLRQWVVENIVDLIETHNLDN